MEGWREVGWKQTFSEWECIAEKIMFYTYEIISKLQKSYEVTFYEEHITDPNSPIFIICQFVFHHCLSLQTPFTYNLF